MTQVLVLNGPNLNLLGIREPQVYGTQTLDGINNDIQREAQNLSLAIDFFQSNAEAELIERIHETLSDGTDFIIINPAAFTHTSVALRDALAGVAVPFIEVHLSNVHAREEFRTHSWFSDIAVGTITGLGSEGYLAALRYVAHIESSNDNH